MSQMRKTEARARQLPGDRAGAPAQGRGLGGQRGSSCDLTTGRDEAALSWENHPCLRHARTVSAQHPWVARRLPFGRDNRGVFDRLLCASPCGTSRGLPVSP